MIQAGHIYTLKVVKLVDFGVYLDAEGEEILLPKRFVPRDTKEDDEVSVFIYHDNDGRLIATTQMPHAKAGDIAFLKVKDQTEHGAFLENGIMKDLFLPLSQQVSRIYPGQEYIVYAFVDEQTGRLTATEKIHRYLSNDKLTVTVNEPVSMIVWQKTDIGYKVIINNRHTGVLHFSDVFRDLAYGEKLQGFIKAIREGDENEIDVSMGERGYKRVGTETEKILSLLHDNNGYLPYNDKSAPEAIYEFFGISKKTFKMAVGALYKDRKVEITKEGIKLLEE